MLNRLGPFVSRHWIAVLVFWVLLVIAFRAIAPSWSEVMVDGDFAYLPDTMTSVRGERLLDQAFPEKLAKSQLVIIVARAGGPLTDEDFAVADGLSAYYTPKDDEQGPVVSVLDRNTEVFGQKFVSQVGPHGQAALVLLQLSNEFMAVGNMSFLRTVKAHFAEVEDAPTFPKGLQLEVSGSAALGGDMLFSAEQSIRNTERGTVLLVLVILLLVYRAPGLVLIPLTTIVVSVAVAKNLVAAISKFSLVTGLFSLRIFTTTEIFVIVILFGAGTDFCLFLIARYREELQRGMDSPVAIAHALSQVSGALIGSALTTVLGLGMMFFADFGKFSDGGPSIALCLLVALAACLTLAPALLRAAGRWVFWPFGVGTHLADHEPTGETDDTSEAVEPALRGTMWDRIAGFIITRPGLILVGSLCVLAPLAYRGLSTTISYDLVNELSEDLPSVKGTRLLRQHFLPGEVGPITLLTLQEDNRFDTPEGQAQIARLTKYLFDLTYRHSSGNVIRPILSVRSLTEPLGSPPGTFNPLTRTGRQKLAVLKHPRTKATYLSQSGMFAHRVARFDLVLQFDPFSRESVEVLNYLERQLLVLGGEVPLGQEVSTSDSRLLHRLGEKLAERGDADMDTLIGEFPADQQARLRKLPELLTGGDQAQFRALAALADPWYKTRFDMLGITAGIRDLEAVTTSDQSRIRILVTLAVLGVLLVLLRQPLICFYLIFSVLFSYFVTIGIAESFFEWLYAGTYQGLDWKVPQFLFVILIAIGQDYNIYLVTRVLEEQRHFGLQGGLRRALVHTGGIITSCGVIMAGTFVSMISGTLRAMVELGMALSLGVMLDTLVIRTILVPAFLALKNRMDARRQARFEQAIQPSDPEPLLRASPECPTPARGA